MNEAISPGTYLPSEQFPIFKLIPKAWNPANARAEESFRHNTRLFTKALNHVEERRDRGDKRKSLLDDILDDTMQLDAFKGTMLPNFFRSYDAGCRRDKCFSHAHTHLVSCYSPVGSRQGPETARCTLW